MHLSRLTLRLLGRIGRDERGIALPTAMFATIAAFALGSAALIASVDSQRGSTRDSGSKSAIAAADAGANIAMMRLNRYASAFTSDTPCLGVVNGVLTLTGTAADGWCPAVSGTVGGATYSYRISPWVEDSPATVISTGSAHGVTRRISTDFTTSTVNGLLSNAGLIGESDVTLSNSVSVKVGVGTNGNISLSNTATICGDIRYGVGKKVTYKNSSHQCAGFTTTEGNQALPDVSTLMPSDLATNNSNYRLVECEDDDPPTPAGCESDPYSSNNHNWPWDPDTRTLTLANSSSLTLGGGDYFMCKLVLRNSSNLYMALGAHVRIFFDSPENCGLSGNPVTQVDIGNSSHIISTGYGDETLAVPGLYLMGSPTIPTEVSFGNSSGSNHFVLYAPNTDIDIKNSATFKGAIVGKTITLANSVVIEQDDGFQAPVIGGATLYQRQRYSECTGAVASPPDAGC